MKRKHTWQLTENGWGLLFIAPTLFGILFFTVLPIFASFTLSFFDWNLVATPVFKGLGNYKYIFQDELFWKVMRNTIYFTIFFVPAKIFISLFLANMLNEKIKGKVFFRAIYFMPAITSAVAISLVWSWLLNYDFGIVNLVLSIFGIQGPDWLGDKKWAMISVVAMAVWQSLGYSMVIYLAALQNVPSSLTEAAQIDGAGRMRIFWKIKIPMLSPTTFFLVMTNVFYGLQVFTEVFMLTKQGPADATNVLATYMYDFAFRFQKIGIGSAVACVMFVIMAALTFVQFRCSRWVHYD